LRLVVFEVCSFAHLNAEALKIRSMLSSRYEPNWAILYRRRRGSTSSYWIGKIELMPGVGASHRFWQKRTSRCVFTNLSSNRLSHPLSLPILKNHSHDHTGRLAHAKPSPECYLTAIRTGWKKGTKIIGLRTVCGVFSFQGTPLSHPHLAPPPPSLNIALGKTPPLRSFGPRAEWH